MSNDENKTYDELFEELELVIDDLLTREEKRVEAEREKCDKIASFLKRLSGVEPSEFEEDEENENSDTLGGQPVEFTRG